MRQRAPEFLPASRRATRGTVAVLVLVTVALASFLLMAFIRRSGTELLADARAAERRQLRSEAYSALEATIAMLAAQREADGALHSPEEGWADLVSATGYVPKTGLQVEIGFSDESGKISLPQADAVTLETALENAGLDQGAAEKMSNAMLAWSRKGQPGDSTDTDSPDYTRNDPPYGPAHRPILSWSELGAIEMDRRIFYDEDGRATDVLRTFMRDFSLQSFQHSNLNTASATVLATLGLGTGPIDALENYRTQPKRSDQPSFFRSMAEAATVVGSAASLDHFSTSVEMLRINITVHRGAIVQRLTAVIAPPGASNRRVAATDPT
ncbi:MAG TPA: hypothetical protein VFJ90_04410, partial [Candidatus Didemnitutus sp.]|nr:hypothetical protein [Candidatus Didemnitutus sp.]